MPADNPQHTPRRRLAAILAADVVGYSRMMQADEAGTLTALKERPRENPATHRREAPRPYRKGHG